MAPTWEDGKRVLLHCVGYSWFRVDLSNLVDAYWDFLCPVVLITYGKISYDDGHVLESWKLRIWAPEGLRQLMTT